MMCMHCLVMVKAKNLSSRIGLGFSQYVSRKFKLQPEILLCGNKKRRKNATFTFHK